MSACPHPPHPPPPLSPAHNPQLDWPALVRALVQSLDDLGCRPRQFSAAQARAIRNAQKARGLTAALWEGWEELADVKSKDPHDPIAGLAGEAGAALLASLGLQDGDLAAASLVPNEELWARTAPDVFAWGPLHEKADADAPQLPGVTLRGARLEDIHLVPVTGSEGSGEDGARMPYINVRARCVPRSRLLKDRSPWG